MDSVITYLRQLNMCSMMLRIVLAMLIGGALGLDRARKQRPAGFRTFMLVAMGAAITMILSQYLDAMLSTQWLGSYEAVGRRTDVVRLGARVISGIGFIGTGTILITARNEVKGLTTASGLWAAACIGIAVGAGFYECVIISFVLIILCMRLLPLIESAVLANARNMNIYVELDSADNLTNLVNKLKAKDITLYEVEINREKSPTSLVQMNVYFSLRLPQRRPHTEILAALAMEEGIAAIEEI